MKILAKMMGHGNYFMEWKEQFVSQERGNRVVHYFLKDSAGESILAVVGTERSVRHMFYVVADEFLRAHGKESSVHAGFKWRSRREVVDWLTSMLSKQHSSGDHSEPCKFDAIQTLGSLQFSQSGVVIPQSDIPDDKVRPSRNSKGLASDIVWSGAAWTCGKRLKHYPSFSRNGTSIMVQSFVYVMAKGENHYLAYLEDMYEDKRCQKKVKVRWFHHSQEVKGVITLRNSHPKEVFITPYVQAISVECVDGSATVLNREHYEKCVNAFPHDSLSKVHLCYRQFKSNRLKPFDLSKLRGYFDQPVFSCLSLNGLSKSEHMFDNLTGEDDEDLDPKNNVRPKVKRIRNAKGCGTFEFENAKVRKSGSRRHMLTHKSCQKHGYSFLGSRFLSHKHVLNDNDPMYEVNEKIELLCQDSGIRGCWFRCTVLHASPKQIRVQYDDLQDEDGYGNLEEWVPAYKVALPDKLGMRHPHRLITRPAPQEQIELTLDLGVAVDAWWSDGWWEGVVAGVDDSGKDDVDVYFPGESLFLNIHRTNLRISRDWFEGRWINVEAKPSILSTIPDTNRTDDKQSKSVAHVKSNSLAMPCIDANAGTDFSQIKEETLEETAIASLEKLREANDEQQKQVSSEEDEQSEDDMADTKNTTHNMKNNNGESDDNTSSGSEDDNGDNSNGVKSEMDSMEASEQNCREEEAEDMDMDMEGVDE
ncbi:uncharacterized protein LOC101209069 [Cucumis sativus]|uniref:BAH domain-containing protein n=1 Tax=Cucumis sativus TaxID=3659 RepID=A0A0A0K8F5_CUCSA|nr:uncharacterized protein LOC101209069 [Cucumis sativus]KGN44066.1 hypothetical protein Csa_015492 [Cucumis sativus]